jgi:hypothetical protein
MARSRDPIVQELQRHNYGLLINNEQNGIFADIASTSLLIQDLLAKVR